MVKGTILGKLVEWNSDGWHSDDAETLAIVLSTSDSLDFMSGTENASKDDDGDDHAVAVFRYLKGEISRSVKDATTGTIPPGAIF